VALVTGFVVVVLLLAGMAVAGLLLVYGDPEEQARRSARRVLHHTRQADLQIAVCARDARRAMNNAAGQSWRNRFE
jgi:hypothetical protein